MCAQTALGRIELGRYIRARLGVLLYDDAAGSEQGIAIYSLSDPRDIRAVRYVGQSAAPRRRLLQHLGTARLWLPDETPWWVQAQQLRPLYGWIRALYADERRLPVMVVREWVEKPKARSAERAHIQSLLGERAALLNYEAELLGAQLVLPLSVSTDARPAAPAR